LYAPTNHNSGETIFSHMVRAPARGCARRGCSYSYIKGVISNSDTHSTSNHHQHTPQNQFLPFPIVNAFFPFFSLCFSFSVYFFSFRYLHSIRVHCILRSSTRQEDKKSTVWWVLHHYCYREWVSTVPHGIVIRWSFSEFSFNNCRQWPITLCAVASIDSDLDIKQISLLVQSTQWYWSGEKNIAFLVWIVTYCVLSYKYLIAFDIFIL
jgi:hypothetical protein